MSDATLGDDVVRGWRRMLQTLHRGHWDAARRYERIYLAVGIAATLAAAATGTAAFTQLASQVEQSPALWLQIVVGAIAIATAALTALQTFMRSADLAVRHKQAALKYGRLRRQLEEQLALGLPAERGEREKILSPLRAAWDAADDESPPVPQDIYRRIRGLLKNAPR